MLVLSGAGLLVKFVRLLHLAAQVGVDAQSMGLRVSFKIRRMIKLEAMDIF